MRIVYNITSHFTSYTRSRQHSNLNKSTGKKTIIWISESHYNDGVSLLKFTVRKFRKKEKEYLFFRYTDIFHKYIPVHQRWIVYLAVAPHKSVYKYVFYSLLAHLRPSTIKMFSPSADCKSWCLSEKYCI